MRTETFRLRNDAGGSRVLELPMHLLQIQGLAMPPFENRSTRYPGQHGATFQRYSLAPRPIQLAILLKKCSRRQLWTLRRDLVELLNPLNGSMSLDMLMSDGTRYFLHNLRYDAGFEMGTDGMVSPSAQQVAFRLIAYDPVWYRHPMNTHTPALTIAAGLVFPITFPIVFGTTELNASASLTADGSWYSYPFFFVIGPLGGLTITNTTTDEKLVLDYFIPDGQPVWFSTAPGDKYVDGVGFALDGRHLIGYLSEDSDLVSFHMNPGINAFTFAASGCKAGTSSIVIQWWDAFLGV